MHRIFEAYVIVFCASDVHLLISKTVYQRSAQPKHGQTVWTWTVSVSEFVGDGVKIPLRHFPLSPQPPLHRYQLVLSIFLVLLDSYVSYIPLRCTSMLQYTVMIRKLGHDRCGKGIGKMQ